MSRGSQTQLNQLFWKQACIMVGSDLTQHALLNMLWPLHSSCFFCSPSLLFFIIRLNIIAFQKCQPEEGTQKSLRGADLCDSLLNVWQLKLCLTSKFWLIKIHLHPMSSFMNFLDTQKLKCIVLKIHINVTSCWKRSDRDTHSYDCFIAKASAPPAAQVGELHELDTVITRD